MNVTATTLPRSRRSESRALSWLVSVNSGAGPMRGRRATPFASAAEAHVGAPHIASATKSAMPRTVRGLTLSLELLLELVDEAPVGGVRDDLLRARLDHPDLVEAQGVEADRVFGIEIPPPAVRNLLHRLQRIVVAVPLVGHQPRRPIGLGRAEVGRF